MVVVIVCVVLSAASKVLMDLSSEGRLPWNPDYWDKMRSWKNKWKNGDPAQGERWFTSSTLTVLFSDGWHLMQFFHLNFLFCTLLVFDSLLHVAIYRVVFGLTFEPLYRFLKRS